MKRIQAKLICLFIAVFALLVCSVTVSAAEYLEKIRISSVEVIKLNIDGEYTFLQEYVSSDSSIFEITDKTGKAVSEGTVYLTLPNKKEKKYIVKIEAYYDYITISGDLMIDKGETTSLTANVYPSKLNQDVLWSSSDETVAIINENGVVTALDYGITTIYATSKNDNTCVGETIVLVDDDSLEKYEDIIEEVYGETTTVHVDASDLKAALLALTEQVSQSVVGVEKYVYQRSFGGMNLVSSDFGSGVIYRRDAVMSDDSVVTNVDNVSNDEGFVTYRYYVISSRTVIQNAAELKIYLGDENELTATLIQYDDKIDLSVLTFETTDYIPTIKFGNSDNINRGEFVIAIGNGYGKEYFRSASFGVISYPKRYVATDTDDDQVNDWDSEYIQHDAAINSQSLKTSSSSTTTTTTNSGGNGGALINMKGEVIGINSTKISATTVDNMSFAIPSNLVQQITSMLELGNKLDRPILGVQIVDVARFNLYKTEYLAKYPEMQVIVDSGLDYGFYVSEVENDGVAKAAGCKAGDIIIEFNGVKVKYSYMLRAELGKFIKGSGQSTTLKVWRDGGEVTLNVTF